MPLKFEESPELTCHNFHSRDNYGAFLYGEAFDIGGGTITREEIDILAEHPELERISIAGLHQDTFDYFVERYGHRFKAIHFFKNKMVSDLSSLGTLDSIEVIGYFLNQRAERLWDMSGNSKLRMLEIDDFSRLHDLTGIETAPSLEALEFGNAIWARTVIDTIPDMSGSPLKRACYNARTSLENTHRLLQAPHLRDLDFSSNIYPTEFIAWICSNYPELEGCSLRSYIVFDDGSAVVTGQRKPHLNDINSDKDRKKAENAAKRFDKLKDGYRGMSFEEFMKSIGDKAAI